jgi:hypothetical protein
MTMLEKKRGELPILIGNHNSLTPWRVIAFLCAAPQNPESGVFDTRRFKKHLVQGHHQLYNPPTSILMDGLIQDYQQHAQSFHCSSLPHVRHVKTVLYLFSSRCTNWAILFYEIQ